MWQLALIVGELAVYGFVVGLLRMFSFGIRSSLFGVLASSPCVFVLAGVLYLVFVRSNFIEHFDLPHLYQGVFVALLTIIVGILLVGDGFPEIASVLSWCARVGFVMLLWLALTSLSQRSSKSPLAVFGLGWGVYMSFLAAGTIAGGFVDTSSQTAFFLSAAYLLAVTTVLSTSIYRNRESKYFAKLPAEGDGEGIASAVLGQDEALQSTVDEFNAHVVGNHTEGLSIDKSANASPISTPPYYAFYPFKLSSSFVGAGVKTNENAQVVMADGTAIKNLYAAGELQGGFAYDEYFHGAQQCRAAVFGYLSAEHAAGALA